MSEKRNVRAVVTVTMRIPVEIDRVIRELAWTERRSFNQQYIVLIERGLQAMQANV